MVIATVMETIILVPKAQNVLSPTAPPDALNSAAVGIKGGRRPVTATVSPAVGVGTSNIENGSSVEVPVGVAVMDTPLSWISNAEQAPAKTAIHMPVDKATEVSACLRR
jgi:hypothetical protein